MYGLMLAVVSAVLFGAATPASKPLLGSLEPFQLAGLLYAGAALGMLPVVARERQRGSGAVLDRANLLRLAGSVLFGGALGPVLLLAALHRALAGSVALLLNFEVVATAVLGVALFREHLGRSGWIGVSGVVTAGVLVASEGGWPGLASALLTLAACTCWGFDNHLTARIDGLTPARTTLVKGAIAGATNLSIGLALDPLRASAETSVLALAVGALCYGASIALYIRSAHELGAVRAQAVFACAPFAGAALAFGLLGEPLGAAHAAASLLLLPSIGLLLMGQHSHAHVHEPIEHTHAHRHDDGHHLHEHAEAMVALRHSHVHRHEALAHAHPHWPDVHHRHEHRS